MSDSRAPTPTSARTAQPQWVEIPSGEVLYVERIQGDTVEGYRVLKTGKKVKFTGSIESWLKIVAKYGSF